MPNILAIIQIDLQILFNLLIFFLIYHFFSFHYHLLNSQLSMFFSDRFYFFISNSEFIIHLLFCVILIQLFLLLKYLSKIIDCHFLLFYVVLINFVLLFYLDLLDLLFYCLFILTFFF